jgi:hypothetical protein
VEKAGYTQNIHLELSPPFFRGDRQVRFLV